MIRYVVDALRASPAVERVLVVCDAAYPRIAGVDTFIPARGNMVDNLAAGLAACGRAAEAALLASADTPFLTGEAVSDFISRCEEARAALGYAVIPRAANEARFPSMRRTYARVAEGEFTGGNLFYIRRDLWAAVERVLSSAYEARKKPWLLAHLLGPRILWRYFRHTVTIPEAESRVSGLLGGACRAIITPYAEIGADVDVPADLAIARAMLGPPP
jgi:hypothetical protein